MEFKKITAIIRPEVFDKVEQRLQQIGVGGMTVSKVDGYGEHANFFKKNWLVTHVQLNIFTDAVKSQEIAEAIKEAAFTGSPGDGIVAVIPVDSVFHIDAHNHAATDDG